MSAIPQTLNNISYYFKSAVNYLDSCIGISQNSIPHDISALENYVQCGDHDNFKKKFEELENESAVNPNTLVSTGESLLTLAIQYNQTKIIDFLENRKNVCKETLISRYVSSLENYICYGNLEKVTSKFKQMFEKLKAVDNSNLDFPNLIVSTGESLLTLAIRYNQIDIVRFLKSEGADVFKPDENKLNPVNSAILNSGSILSILLDINAQPSSFTEAKANPELSYSQLLDAKGIADNIDRKPWLAAMHKDTTLLEEAKKGGRANALNLNNLYSTTLYIEVECQYSYSCKKPEENREALFDLKCNRGFTPLHFAIAFKRWKNVSFLIKEGASIHIKDKNNVSPLDLIVYLTKQEDPLNLSKNQIVLACSNVALFAIPYFYELSLVLMPSDIIGGPQIREMYNFLFNKVLYGIVCMMFYYGANYDFTRKIKDVFSKLSFKAVTKLLGDLRMPILSSYANFLIFSKPIKNSILGLFNCAKFAYRRPVKSLVNATVHTINISSLGYTFSKQVVNDVGLFVNLSKACTQYLSFCYNAFNNENKRDLIRKLPRELIHRIFNISTSTEVARYVSNVSNDSNKNSINQMIASNAMIGAWAPQSYVNPVSSCDSEVKRLSHIYDSFLNGNLDPNVPKDALYMLAPGKVLDSLSEVTSLQNSFYRNRFMFIRNAILQSKILAFEQKEVIINIFRRSVTRLDCCINPLSELCTMYKEEFNECLL